MSAKKITGKQVRFTKMDERQAQNSGGETITDIQNYLETFNKEIEGGEPTVQQVGVKYEPSSENSQNVESGEEGTYYVDQAGQYYYQTRSEDGQHVMTVVQRMPANSPGTVQNQFVPVSESQSDGEHTTTEDVQVVDDGGQVVLRGGTPGDSYQTVTIVPSEASPGEVSYVLIVQPEGHKEKEEDQDLTVYDFDDQEEPGAVSAAESVDEEDKSKIMKIIPKKSQTVTQAHMCNYCNYTSPKRYLLSRHMKSHSEERPHKCSVCERGFKTLASLQNHVNTHTGTKPHRCKYCQSAFTTSGELVRHVRYKHTHEKPHKCTICEYASVELSKMRNHMRCHTGERPYQCPHCTYASPDTFKLKRHLRIHTGEKPYECDVCHARFTQSNSMKAHKLIHSAGDKPVYQCELCPATCGRKTDLRIHVQKLHTSDKPLKCKRCGKQFPDRYTYKVHNKSHEGEKCWKCELCPYASVSQRHLESHMLIHTDQKPFQCEQCDQMKAKQPRFEEMFPKRRTLELNVKTKAFRQKQLLKRHQNLYHNPNYVPPPPREKTHECPECQRAFRHKGNLIRHMSAHDPESTVHEKAIALKLGRQKKIQIIDGQQVEVIPGDERLDEMEGSVMAVEGSDGQQYVVLEVIQLQDGEGGEQQVAVMAGDGGLEQAVAVLNSGEVESDEEEDEEEEEEDDEELITPDRIKSDSGDDRKDSHGKHGAVPTSMQQDMDNCFGFDEEDDEEEEEEQEIPTNNTVHILQPAIH